MSSLSRAAPSPSPVALAAAPWLGAAFVVVWAAWAIAFNTAQFGDNLEQFNWAHSLEWGYYKHPPMPTWMLGTLIELFGPSRWWAIVLAALCALGTAAFTAGIAAQLVGPWAPVLVLPLWSLALPFSTRVQLYNHNMTLVLFVAAAVWCALRATRGGFGWWLATGLAAGAALLSKYQAVVPLAGLLLALGWSGRLQGRAQRLGLAAAVLLALAVFAPHAVWVVQHDYTTLRYASEAVDPEGPQHRGGVLLSFVANQLRMLMPCLVAALVCWLASLRAPRGAAPEALDERETRIWLIGLVWAPLAVVLLLGLVGGVTLRNHWGVQTLQFVALWMAWRWRRVLFGRLATLLVAAVAIQAISLGYYAVKQRDPQAIASSRRMDTVYPAQRIADAALALWRDTTGCPLRYVAGPSFPAGLISLYGGGTAAVQEGPTESPWVDPAAMRRAGSIVVAEGANPLPPGVSRSIRFELAPPGEAAPGAPSLTIGVRPPEVPCP